MIEIKFRAWAVASNIMFYPETDNGWEIINGKINILPNTILMQYTGLNDRNGKEIYEGDIWERDGHIAEVCFEKTKWTLKTLPISNSIQFPDFYYNAAKGRIIGNIFENPELLEKRSERRSN